MDKKELYEGVTNGIPSVKVLNFVVSSQSRC